MKTKTGRFSRRIAMLLMLIAACGMLYAPAFAEGETGQGENTDQIIYASYALEFSYTDGEDNTTFYETADVKKISVAEIAEQLGLTGEITKALDAILISVARAYGAPADESVEIRVPVPKVGLVRPKVSRDEDWYIITVPKESGDG